MWLYSSVWKLVRLSTGHVENLVVLYSSCTMLMLVYKRVALCVSPSISQLRRVAADQIQVYSSCAET